MTGNVFVGGGGTAANTDNKVMVTAANLPNQHLSSDNKRSTAKQGKNQLSLKEQVILEALRKNSSSNEHLI